MDLRGPTGYVVRYKANAGCLDRPFGVAARLSRDSDGSYTLRWFRKGVRWLFTSAGRLDRIIGQNDNMIRPEYDTAGKLVKVEGGLVNGSAAVRRRRIITLAYTGTKVTSISEHQLARTYTYTYDPTAGSTR